MKIAILIFLAVWCCELDLYLCCRHNTGREKFKNLKTKSDDGNPLLFTGENDKGKTVQNGPMPYREKHVSAHSSIFWDDDEDGALQMGHSEKVITKLRNNVDGWIEKITCKACKVMISELQAIANKTDDYNALVDKTIELCIEFKMNDARVCRMIIEQYKFEAHFVLVHLVLSPDEACGILLGKNCSIPYYPGSMWNVTLPDIPKPVPQPPKPPKLHSPTVRFVQITDIHIDFQYEAGTPDDCREPICCRNNVNGTGTTSAGQFGDYVKCDIPSSLAVALFKHLSTIQDQFDYVIFTGDIPAHDLWNQSKSDQLAHQHLIDDLFKTYLPYKPVYYAIGNHDSAPCDSFPPPVLNVDMSWLYDTLVDVWGRWLPPDTEDMIRRCASYSVSPTPGFRIISLNNIYSSRLNFWLLVEDEDPCGVLDFFAKELQKAETAGEKVHVLTHIPPGIDYMRKAWSYNYYKIISRYENTIVNQFFGHQHTDSFEIFYDIETLTRPLSVGFVAPSVTAWKYLNPTYRIYTMDGNYEGSSFAVLDYITYYLDLGKANKHQDASIWEYGYSPKSMFQMKSLYPKDWDDFANRMEKDDALFQLFFKAYNNMYPIANRCELACKETLLCSLREGRSYDPKLCKIHRGLAAADD